MPRAARHLLELTIELSDAPLEIGRLDAKISSHGKRKPSLS
jgi:hypothetical protein